LGEPGRIGMRKEILLSTRAQKDFKALSKKMKTRIKETIMKLSKGEKHLDIKKLKGVEGGEDLYRLRVGDYRIIYFPEKRVIKVIRIDRRNKIYDWLE
jgi:mRNA interferase RelE/StbE